MTNRVKITVKDDSGKLICKIGTSMNAPKSGIDYTNQELANMLRSMADMLATEILIDTDL